MKRGVIVSLVVVAVVLCAVIDAYGADTYYEVWRSPVGDPGNMIRLPDAAWLQTTSYDDYSATPGQHYYYWVRVVTAETKEAYKYSLGSGVSMFLQIKCPIAAETGTESPIRVRVAMSTLFPPYAVGDLTCRIREKDLVIDNTMEEWTEYDVYVNPGSDIYDVTYDNTWTKDIIISDYEIISPAQVYLWSSYLHQWAIDVYNLEQQTDSISVALRDFSDDAPSNISASQGTYPDRVHVTWDPATGNSDITSGFIGWASDSVPDTFPPTPNPMTWLTEPYETSTSSISMVATTAVDQSTPISYYFEFYSSPTGGTGGTDSGWQSSTTYTDSGLSANHQYGYRVKAKDANNNETSYSSPVSYEYTHIESPSGITFGTITATSIQAKSTNTPSGLNRAGSGLIIYNVTEGTDSGWKQNNDYWNSGSLSVNTQYGFKAKARNGDAGETGYCSTEYKYTAANPPGASSLSNITTNSIQANWLANDNPVGTEYYCLDTYTDQNSGWITDTYWNCDSLTPNTLHRFRIHAKNHDEVETSSYSYTQYQYTLANAPGADSFSNVTAHSIQANWTANGNPGGTEYYCENITEGTNSGWTTNTYWKLFSLSPNTQYGFRVKAKNKDEIETDYSATQYQYTLANIPKADLFSNRAPDSVQVNWNANGNPPGTEYYCENITNDANSGWITDISWLCEGLTEGTPYSFQVKARNEEGIETESINLGCTYGGGAGEPNNPYLIYAAEHLNAIGANPADWDKYFLLTNDINLSSYTGIQFNVIGTLNNPFTGVCDGNGCTISNFTYTSTDLNDIGLFSCIRDGQIKDLGLVNVNIDVNNGNNVGGLVGFNIGTISGCYITGIIKGNNNVGGLAGYSLGGLYGWYLTPGYGHKPFALPLFANNIVSDCYTTANIDGNSCAGGLIGRSSQSTITNCYTIGAVDANEYGGGLVGYDSNSIFTKCFWNIEINPDINGVGNTFDSNAIGKTTAELQTKETFIDAGWDFVSDSNKPSNIWAMPNGGGYPILWWQLSELPELPSFSGGSGSPNEPYLISTNEELNRIGHNPRLMNSHFQLINDINLSAIDFFMIGSRGYPYRGVFDGDGYTIRNFYLISDAINNIGLFGCICDSGKVNNLALENTTINAGTGNYVGGIVGYNYKGTISNCHVSGSVSGGNYVALLVGKSQESIIADSWAIGTVSGYDDIGGLVGWNHYSTVLDSYASSDTTGGSDVGGLIGLSISGEIINCFADHNSISDSSIGGLIGWSIECTITNCHASGHILGNMKIGGFLGTAHGSRILNCYAIGDTGGDYYIGGLVGYSVGCIITDCYANGSVVGSIKDIGGLVGFSHADKVSNCYSCGAVDGNDWTGALVGALSYPRGGAPSYHKCFWDNTVNSGLYGCGHHPEYPPIIDPNIIGKSTQEMQEKDTYLDAGWDFVGETANGTEDIWDICEGTNYPKLVWQIPAGDFICPDGVTMVDFSVFGAAWMSDPNLPNWNPICDISDPNDNFINELDLKIFVDHWLEGL